MLRVAKGLRVASFLLIRLFGLTAPLFCYGLNPVKFRKGPPAEQVEEEMALSGEELPEVWKKRIDPDGFQGECVGVGMVEFAATLRFANAEPVGRLVTDTSKTSLLDEGLQQHGAVAVAVLPIKREQACSHAQ